MALQAADHYVITGQGLSATVDISSIDGTSLVALTVDGQGVSLANFGDDRIGLNITGNISAIPDLSSSDITIIFPEINIENEAVTAPGLAVLTVTQDNIGGPRRVRGALQSYSIRPVVVTGSLVESIA